MNWLFFISLHLLCLFDVTSYWVRQYSLRKTIKIRTEGPLPMWSKLVSLFNRAETADTSSIPKIIETSLDFEPQSEPVSKDTLIIGAGLAGLSCAMTLKMAGQLDFEILEAGDVAGGRVATDVHEDGYLLDRGFQVFIEEYPESRRLLSDVGYEALDLQPFRPGAFVFKDGTFHVVSDPLRCPEDLISSVISPIGSFLDKVKVGLYSFQMRFGGSSSESYLNKASESSTEMFLQSELQLSDSMIDSFFTPFFRGIFLSELNEQSSKMFEFVFWMFARGSASLPKSGMGSIGKYLANQLGEDIVKFNTKAVKIDRLDKKWLVTTGSNNLSYKCNNVVIATDPEEFLKLQKRDDFIPPARGSVCLYYGFDGEPPITSPVLILNAKEDAESAKVVARVNNVCFPSQVSREYAPAGKSIASVTVVDPAALPLHDLVLDSAVKKQLGEWWGQDVVKSWKLLRVYRIPYAQPAQNPPYKTSKPLAIDDGLFVCGDHRNTATLNGAIKSGRLVAQDILKMYV